MARPNECSACRNEPEPGYIEMDNNGPIVPCWLCNREEWLTGLRRDVRDAVRDALSANTATKGEG